MNYIIFIMVSTENRGSWYHGSDEEAREALTSAEVTGNQIVVMDPTNGESFYRFVRNGDGAKLSAEKLLSTLVSAWVASDFEPNGMIVPRKNPAEYTVLNRHGDRCAEIDGGPLMLMRYARIQTHARNERVLRKAGVR